MSDDFTPRLGRPGDRARGVAKRYGARVKRAAKRIAKPKRNLKFSGERIGRGSAAARMSQFRSHPFAKFRMRRVIVKVHIARAGKGIGKAAFRAHVKYIQRDGVCVETSQGERQGGELYNGDKENLDDRAFLERSTRDPHQFRIIVSPEDADQLEDLKGYIREVMAVAEKDLATRLDWIAVDHWNTGHPHSHVVIRGKDGTGRDLVIARDYLTRGLRARAEAIVLERLGPRRNLEIARGQAREVEARRFTGIDRRLAVLARDDLIEVAPAAGPGGNFERSLRLRRLKFLERLGLAAKLGVNEWRLANGWDDRLRETALKGDIIRSIAARTGKEVTTGELVAFGASTQAPQRIVGRVIADAPADEMRDTRFLIVESRGKLWRVSTGDLVAGALPPAGAIIEVRMQAAAPLRSDRTIARIASLNQGVYSEALHQADDPSASKTFIEAHKRRLEALRRASIVMREKDGSWRVGPDYLGAAARYEMARGAGTVIDVKSWINFEAQLERCAPVWLDDADEKEFGKTTLSADIAAAKARRKVFLKHERLWSEKTGGINPAVRASLAAKELHDEGEAASRRIGKTYRPMKADQAFEGVYDGKVDLAQGRFAVIVRSKEFTLVPWRAELERVRGVALIIRRKSAGIQWALAKGRGLNL